MVVVYTDASRSPSNGRFGWGAVCGGVVAFQVYGSLPEARTINHAETLAIVNACAHLASIGHTGPIVVYTDAQQAIQALTSPVPPRQDYMREVRDLFWTLPAAVTIALRWLPRDHPEREGLHGDAHALAGYGARSR